MGNACRKPDLAQTKSQVTWCSLQTCIHLTIFLCHCRCTPWALDIPGWTSNTKIPNRDLTGDKFMVWLPNYLASKTPNFPWHSTPPEVERCVCVCVCVFSTWFIFTVDFYSLNLWKCEIVLISQPRRKSGRQDKVTIRFWWLWAISFWQKILERSHQSNS